MMKVEENAAGKAENSPPHILPKVFDKNKIRVITLPPMSDLTKICFEFIGNFLRF